MRGAWKRGAQVSEEWSEVRKEERQKRGLKMWRERRRAAGEGQERKKEGNRCSSTSQRRRALFCAAMSCGCKCTSCSSVLICHVTHTRARARTHTHTHTHTNRERERESPAVFVHASCCHASSVFVLASCVCQRKACGCVRLGASPWRVCTSFVALVYTACCTHNMPVSSTYALQCVYTYTSYAYMDKTHMYMICKDAAHMICGTYAGRRRQRSSKAKQSSVGGKGRVGSKGRVRGKGSDAACKTEDAPAPPSRPDWLAEPLCARAAAPSPLCVSAAPLSLPDVCVQRRRAEGKWREKARRRKGEREQGQGNRPGQ